MPVEDGIHSFNQPGSVPVGYGMQSVHYTRLTPGQVKQVLGCQVSVQCDSWCFYLLWRNCGTFNSLYIDNDKTIIFVNRYTPAASSLYAMAPPKYDGLSHCKLALAFAVVMDLLGVTALLLGVFAPLEMGGRDFGDLLVYSGALLVLMSLGGWVLWYSGNIEGLTSARELGGTVGGAMDRLARNLSRRIRIPRTHSSPS